MQKLVFCFTNLEETNEAATYKRSLLTLSNHEFRGGNKPTFFNFLNNSVSGGYGKKMQLKSALFQKKNEDELNFYFPLVTFTLFRMRGGRGQKKTRNSFFIVTYTNVGISPQNFLTFGFKTVPTLV